MSSDPEVIAFECPKCRTHLRTSAENAGKHVRCSKCNNRVGVPESLVDIDFSFHDDIEDVIAKANSKPVVEVVSINPKSNETAEAREGESASEKKVISNDDLPEKRRIRKDLQQRFVQKSGDNTGGLPVDSTEIPGDPPGKVTECTQLQSNVDASEGSAGDVLGTGIAPEQDFSPIHVEGITSESIDVADLYGVKCEICDTRIHVTQQMVDTMVDCPVCFSKVRVTPPKAKSKFRPNWMGPDPGFKEGEPSDANEDLKLSDPIERPIVDVVVDPDHGLPKVERDLLAPRTAEDENENLENEEEAIPELEIVQSEPSNPTADPPARKLPKSLPSSEGNPGPLPTEVTNRSGTRKEKTASLRERFENTIEDTDEQRPMSVHTSEKLIPLTFKSITELIASVLNDPAVIWRAAVAFVLLTLGGFFYHLFDGTMGADAEKGFPGVVSFLWYGFLYFSMQGIGTIWLWYICSCIFRDTARGFIGVESFKPASFSEFKSTFLLFAISFAVAGSPFLMMGAYVSAPMRILIAPMLLIVAWFNQSAWIGVSFEPFATMRTETDDWKHFYVYVLGLALATMLGGLFFIVPYCGAIGAAIMVVATLAFSAITGWHCGRMVKKLEEIN